MESPYKPVVDDYQLGVYKAFGQKIKNQLFVEAII